MHALDFHILNHLRRIRCLLHFSIGLFLLHHVLVPRCVIIHDNHSPLSCRGNRTLCNTALVVVVLQLIALLLPPRLVVFLLLGFIVATAVLLLQVSLQRQRRHRSFDPKLYCKQWQQTAQS
jgi:Flp pilus assembly protein TadB